MKKTLGMLALAGAMAVGPTYAKADDTAAIFTTLAAALLASQFSVSQPMIIADASRYRTTVYDMEPAYYIRYRTPGVTIAQIMALRAAGLPWDMVARRVNMPASYIVNLAPTGAYYPTTYWSDWAYRQYQIPPAEFVLVRNSGAPWNDAFLAAELAHRYNTRPIYVWRGYRQARTWNRIVLPNRRIITVRGPFRPATTWRTAARTWRPRPQTEWRRSPIANWRPLNGGNRTTWQQNRRTSTAWQRNHKVTTSSKNKAALRVKGWTHTEKKGGKVDVWHHNGPKVDITRRVSHHNGTTVRTTRVHNPAQTITRRTVYRNGKVVRSTTTHNKDKTPGHVTKTQRKRTQWYLDHPKKR